MRDFTDDIRDVQRRLREAHGYLRVDELRARVSELEFEVSRPDLWDDQDRAKKLNAEYANSKGDLDQYDQLARDVDDVEVVVGKVVDVVEVVVVVVGSSSSAFGTGVSNEKARRFSDPVPGLLTTLRVADVAIADATCAGVSAEFCDNASAATPATCGAAIEVPLSVRVALSEV